MAERRHLLMTVLTLIDIKVSPARSVRKNSVRHPQKGRTARFSQYLDLRHIRRVYVEALGIVKTEDKFDLPQGTLDLLIMRVVALGPIHGYAIAQRIQQMSREALQVQQGSLYPALHRLEYRKLLLAKWQPSETGREAKFYELTAKGRTYLKAETENWKRLTDVVGLILKGTLEGVS